MRKIFDQRFHFLLQRKLGKSVFFEGSGQGDPLKHLMPSYASVR